jgi:hypothetical protein
LMQFSVTTKVISFLQTLALSGNRRARILHASEVAGNLSRSDDSG